MREQTNCSPYLLRGTVPVFGDGGMAGWGLCGKRGRALARSSEATCAAGVPVFRDGAGRNEGGRGALKLAKAMDIRILGGAQKGRRLHGPSGRRTTRPMTGYVKKSLFDMLGARLAGAVVVDLYCGTGTLGLEALSRGAGQCCFAERGRSALAALRRNIEELGVADRCTVWAGDVTRGLSARLETIGRPVDVAFVDPPYETARRWRWVGAVERVFSPLGVHLAGDGVVALRLPGDVEAPEVLGPLVPARRRQYGDMTLLLLSPASAQQ